MTKTKRHTNFLALFLSLVMVFSLVPATVFAAEEHVYFQKKEALEDGEQYVVAVESEGKWYALTGLASKPSSSSNQEFGQRTELTLDGDLVVDAPDLAVWKYSASKTQLSNSVGDLYFASTGVKYQTSTDRPVTYDGNLYATVQRDGNTLKSGDKVYFTFNVNATEVTNDWSFSTTVSSGGTTVPDNAAQIVIYKKLTSDEKEAYDKQKEEEAEQQKVELARELVIAYLDYVTSDDFLKDYSEANQALIKEKVEAARPLAQEATATYDDLSALLTQVTTELNGIPTIKEEEQATVETEKTAANTKLDAFVAEDNLSKYSEANQTKIREAVDACRTQIETAATVDAVKDLVASLETEIAAIPTKQQEEEQAEQKAVEDAKTAANAELDAFVTAENLAKYDDANQAKIKDAVASYRTQIETAATVDAVNALVAAAKEEIKAIPEKKDDSGKDPEKADDVKTAKDTAAKELEAAKAAAGFDAEQKAQIQNIIKIYTTKIQAATTAEQVKTLVAQFNKEVKALPTAAQKQAIKKIAVKIKSVKAGKKKMTVKWKAKKTKFDGYQIKYKVKGKKKWKTATAKKASAAKKIVKKLKKGKKYKVKVRGYKLFGVNKDVKVYGKFSKVKTSKKIK